MVICYETVNFALESSFFFFYAMGIGTPEGHFWLEAVNEMTMQEKSVVSAKSNN